jgi:hypothetical protein
MRLDPAVARRKFERELKRAEAQRTTLGHWGCFVVGATYPHVDAVFVPRKSMRLSLSAAPQRSKGRVRMAGREQQFSVHDIPMLAARAFGIRVDLTDFDQRPPGVSFRDPFTWEPLPFALLPLGQHLDEQGKAMQVVLDSHPVTKLPFLCMRGIREYHEHPQHTGDDWVLYRGHYGLFSVLSTVWRTCVEQVRPNLMVLPNGKRHLLWEAELVS